MTSRDIRRTFGMIKPDAVRQGKIGAILDHIERHDLRIAAMRMLTLARDQAEWLYAAHRGRSYYDEQVDFMTSGPVVALVLEPATEHEDTNCKDVVSHYRTILGATDPDNAHHDTIRGRFGNVRVKRENAAHGSDSHERAEEEIAYFFPEITYADAISSERGSCPCDEESEKTCRHNQDEEGCPIASHRRASRENVTPVSCDSCGQAISDDGDCRVITRASFRGDLIEERVERACCAECEAHILLRAARPLSTDPWPLIKLRKNSVYGKTRALTSRQAGALRTILIRVASWTAARWDQHLRYDVGDEDANAIIAWVDENIPKSAGCLTDA